MGKKKKEFTPEEMDIYRIGRLNGEAATEVRHRRIIIQNRKLRTINRCLVENIKQLQTYDDALRDMCWEHVKHMPIIERLAMSKR